MSAEAFMRLPVRFAFLLFLSAAIAAAAGPSIDALAWMTGHWKTTARGSVSEELWMAPGGGMMLAVNRSVSPKRASFEFIRIAETETGLVYYGSPSGKPAVGFPLEELAGERVAFENPAHDFPQRIIYWRNGDRLCARVEGTVRGKVEGEEWCWERLTTGH